MRILLDYPITLFLVCFVPAWFLLSRFRPAEKSLRRIGLVCGVVSLAVFVGLLVLNLTRSGLLWHDEANVLTVAAAFVNGEPMYHAVSAADFYSLLYGPSTFLVYAPLLWHATRPLEATRIAITLLDAFNIFLLYRVLRASVSPRFAFALIPTATVALVVLPSILLGTRGDMWLLCCLCIALLAALRPQWILASLVSGFFAGLALDFKISLIPLVCLLLAILWRQHRVDRVRASVLFSVTSLVTVLSLFLIPHISLANYAAWLRFGSRQHLRASQFAENLLFAALLIAAPVAVRLFGAKGRLWRGGGWMIPLLYCLGLGSCIVTGAKDGAGLWHLWPMLPFVLFLTGYEVFREGLDPSDGTSGRTWMVIAAISIAATVVTVRYGYRDLDSMQVKTRVARRARERTAEAEIKDAVRRYPDQNVAMGYGSVLPDDRAFLRFELPLQGQDFFLDANAMVEAIKEKVELPDNVAARVNGCTDVWLIPHGEAPFSTTRKGAFAKGESAYLFPDSVRMGFPVAHSLVQSGETYDVWACGGKR